MIFTKTKLSGALIIDLERREDDRGFYARSFCAREFEEHGLKPFFVQSGVAYNKARGTVRGLHFQFPPSSETKLVRCSRGALVDIIVDLRPESKTYLEHVAVELDASAMRALYVPERFAHGYQTLQDDTVVSYDFGAVYTPSAEGGLLHDDPRLGLTWPLPLSAISARDHGFRPLAEVENELRQKMAAETHCSRQDWPVTELV